MIVDSADMPACAFMGVKLHAMTMDQSVRRILEHMRRQVPMVQVSLNVAKLVKMRNDPALAADVMGADMVSADGMGIVLGARLLGLKMPERVAGVDLMHTILRCCAAEGFRPYFLGATPAVLALAMERLAQSCPGLTIAGFRDGYFTDAEELSVVDAIREARPDCLFVGMPTPRKENFMARHHAALAVSFVMGVGGAIDILAGQVRRAPLAWQNAGFEWAYRVWQEPRRMWRRYLVTNTQYAWLLAGAVLRQRAGLDGPPPILAADIAAPT